jgi:hypothetical protein
MQKWTTYTSVLNPTEPASKLSLYYHPVMNDAVGLAGQKSGERGLVHFLYFQLLNLKSEL